MSRTYRKNKCWFAYYQGNNYHTYRKGKTYQGNAKGYLTEDYPIGARYFYEEVVLGDTENIGSGIGRNLKKMYHGIDRARYKAALLKDEDCHIERSFDPWDWD